MSLKSLLRVAIPTTVALIFGISFDAGQLFPLCICGFLFFLFLIRIFASDVGLCSLIAVSITLCLSFFCKHQSMCPVEENGESTKHKKERKNKVIVQDKKKKKDRKKKKGKPMEEDKENVLFVPEKTKVYTTLSQFLELNLTKDELYERMCIYLLTAEELIRNRYPVPGIQGGEEFTKEGVIRRKCCRCTKPFHVSLNDTCEEEEDCVYHPVKGRMVNGVYTYECCGKPHGAIGCKTFSSHVCGKPILYNAVFQNVRDKRQVRAEQKRQVYSIDCEMVYTNFGLQVAKIGIVNLEGLTIYESYVLPENDIIDYNTIYSGITAKDLSGITTTLSDVQTYLDHLLNQDTILIGHGLDSDLKTLRLIHCKVIDTAVLYPRENGTKQKLKDLALSYLNQTIQDDPSGHDCIEDARTCMALVLYKIKNDKITQAKQPNQPSHHTFVDNWQRYALSMNINNIPAYTLVRPNVVDENVYNLRYF